MEKLVFDSGVREYQINDNGVLRFNPSDPNVYARFFDAADEIKAVEADIVEKGKSIDADHDTGESVIRLMEEADRTVKNILTKVFGEPNDFDQILGGVNLLAVASNGERVITNFLNALLPIIQEGAERCAEERVGVAVQQAKLNRAQRRAQ